MQYRCTELYYLVGTKLLHPIPSHSQQNQRKKPVLKNTATSNIIIIMIS